MKTTGIVGKIEFTSGGADNQWTWIDGEQYATYWNCRTKDWRVGDRVEFSTYMRGLWSGMAPILHAQEIRKVPA